MCDGVHQYTNMYTNMVQLVYISFVFEKYKYYGYNYSIMSTTIQVSIATKQLLDTVKKKKHIKTYDRVIQQLLEKQENIPKSMFATFKDMNWTKEDRMDFNER
jgi:hypothetical protein